VCKAIAHTPKDLQGMLHRRFDQTQAGGQCDPCSERPQGPIGLEEGVDRSSPWEKPGMEKTFKCHIDAGNTHQHRSSSTLLEHLQGDRACGLCDLKLVPCWLVQPSRSSTNSEQVSPLVISR
jgi:hypothetical protein